MTVGTESPGSPRSWPRPDQQGLVMLALVTTATPPYVALTAVPDPVPLPDNSVVQQGYFDSATATWNFTGNMGKATGCSGATTEEINPSLVGAPTGP
jgi:hypothetical protein